MTDNVSDGLRAAAQSVAGVSMMVSLLDGLLVKKQTNEQNLLQILKT